ncbi:hypothetical protein CDAR_307471 [Caerostris darwini]|uniref:Uncharacterized protein n=1 Tax=Caerostris darwini TaxID=1538125 RepID=A0AAV4T4J5_9ARAC|nr:hypothetical protein CDAR_307471 [Caerostris darwini]
MKVSFSLEIESFASEPNGFVVDAINQAAEVSRFFLSRNEISGQIPAQLKSPETSVDLFVNGHVPIQATENLNLSPKAPRARVVRGMGDGGVGVSRSLDSLILYAGGKQRRMTA